MISKLNILQKQTPDNYQEFVKLNNYLIN